MSWTGTSAVKRKITRGGTKGGMTVRRKASPFTIHPPDVESGRGEETGVHPDGGAAGAPLRDGGDRTLLDLSRASDGCKALRDSMNVAKLVLVSRMVAYPSLSLRWAKVPQKPRGGMRGERRTG